MTLSEKDRNQLIRYRLEQAYDSIDVVNLLIKNRKLNAAVNRIYYGIFYSLLALAIKYKFETSKHFQLIGWFNKEFIRTKKINVEYGQILKKAYESRRSGDYDAFIEFTKEDIESLFTDMKKFIQFIDDFIKNSPK